VGNIALKTLLKVGARGIMKPKFWYIKERFNPQFDKPYYRALGNISKLEASRHESTLYGYNSIIRFDNEEDYKAALVRLNLAPKNTIETGDTAHNISMVGAKPPQIGEAPTSPC
jgi:hypothetical protein